MKHHFIVIFSLLFGSVQGQDKAVYKCPGNLYTDSLSAREAMAKGCKTLEGTPITIIQAFRPKTVVKNSNGAGASEGSAPGSPQGGNGLGSQKSRDADARLILEAELKKEEEALANLRKDYKNGQPERRGDERQANQYNERVQNMKDAISRKEADVTSIRRELSKLGVAPSTPVSSTQAARFRY